MDFATGILIVWFFAVLGGTLGAVEDEIEANKQNQQQTQQIEEREN